jgi:hypothetical protein
MIGMVLLAAAAGVQLGELKTFRDWVAGCDNGRRCQASAMMPESGGAGATLTVRRDPQGAALPEVWLRVLDGDPADLRADGRPLRIRLTRNEDDAFAVAPADSVRLLDTLRASRSVEVVDRSGQAIAPLSVDGATAALLYIDEQQRRLDTRGALVRRGSRPDSAVPPPPVLPLRYSARATSRPPVRLSRALIAQVRKDNGCGKETDPNLVSHDRLDAGHTLAVITLLCQSGAYNYISESFIIPDRGKPGPVRFDDETNEEGSMHGYNLSWDAKGRRLHAGFKGRGIGDCGGRQQYVWDGQRFRLVEVSGMGECRGVADFITQWRARVVDR